MKLKLTGLELEKFLRKVFPGLTNYRAAKIGNDLQIWFPWKGVMFYLVIYKNKSFSTGCLHRVLVQEMIKKQIEIEELKEKQTDGKITINNEDDFKKLIETLHVTFSGPWSDKTNAYSADIIVGRNEFRISYTATEKDKIRVYPHTSDGCHYQDFLEQILNDKIL